MLVFVVVLIVVLLIVVIAAAFSSKSSKGIRTRRDEIEARRYGEAGENLVAKYLQDVVNTYGGYLYNDFCFEYEHGYSTEIDHILITRGGVFIIETKTNKGLIRGAKEDELWACIKKDYQENKTLKNPIFQNQGHINHLRKMFKNMPPKMISMVIFPVADITYVSSDIVFDLDDATNKIIELTKANTYSLEFVERINSQIKKIQDMYSISKEKHIENIKKTRDKKESTTNEDKLVEIIIAKAKDYGVEKGRVQIFPEILEGEKLYFFGFISRDPHLWDMLGFTVNKESGMIHDLDMEIEFPLFEKEYEKMNFNNSAYKKLCEYLENNHRESWLYIDK